MNGNRQRILRATAANLSWQPQGADGEPADPGAVTVKVVRSDGTTVVAAGTSPTGTGSGARTIALTAAQTAQLDWLTVTWTSGSVTLAETVHEIVGGFYFTVAEAREKESSLADTARDPNASIIAARAEVEALIEEVCNVAFVPRFAVDRVGVSYSSAVLLVEHYQLRRVRWVRTIDRGGTVTSLGSDEVGGFSPSGWGGIERAAMWGCGWVEVGYEHGYDAPPPDLKRAAITAARSAVNATRGGVPDRATFMNLADGGSVTLATPGVGGWHTGIPSVDEVINRYAHPRVAIG